MVRSSRTLAAFTLIAASAALPAVVRAQSHEAHQAHQAHEASAAVRSAIVAMFAAAERKDLTALDTLYAGDSLLIIEGAGINRGWVDYRDNHLGPELAEFQNFKYRPFEIEVRVSGDVAWATFRYALSADVAERKVDVIGRGTAVLEKRGARWVVRLTQTASRARRPTDPPMP